MSIQAIRLLFKLTSWPAVSRTVKKRKNKYQIANLTSVKKVSNKMGVPKFN